MKIDVSSTALIRCDREKVAAFAANPENAPKWYVNIKAAEWETEPPLKPGSRFSFVAHFLGKRLAYTYELVEFVPAERMTMRTSQGPFPMETTYRWEDAPAGATRMTLQNRGEPAGFSVFLAPFMGMAIRRANQKDLLRLKEILENQIR